MSQQKKVFIHFLFMNIIGIILFITFMLEKEYNNAKSFLAIFFYLSTLGATICVIKDKILPKLFDPFSRNFIIVIPLLLIVLASPFMFVKYYYDYFKNKKIGN